MPRTIFDEERCKGCGLCVEACPRHILVQTDRFNQKGYAPARCSDDAACTGCAMCALTCPDVVIEVYREVADRG